MRISALSKSRLTTFAMLGAASIALSACSSMFGDEEEPMALSGTPFSQGLAVAYANLANQAEALPSDEDGGFFSMFDFSDTPGEMLQRAFSAKAEMASAGEEPAPEASPSADVQPVYARLVAAVTAGKARFAEQAARAQSDYDCWVLFSMVPAGAPNAAACKSQLDQSLPALETALRPAPPPLPPAPPPLPAPAPVAQAPVPAPASNEFTVYFDFDSWTLTAENLTVLTNVINSARSGGQTRINVVGHTDTSGASDYNQRLSVRRANVVVEALVNMGARRQAITSSGLGETQLAVQTADGVREEKNRRSVIGLQP